MHAATDARHGGPLAAANLIASGERYGYAFHLVVYRLLPKDLKQLHIDIMCKWGPWCDRTLDALLPPPPATATQQQRQRLQDLLSLVQGANNIREVRKVLSQAHGSLHSQACQILWQPTWTTGCAKTVGEEGEQFFSYWSKWALSTRNQSNAGVHIAHTWFAGAARCESSTPGFQAMSAHSHSQPA